MMTSSTRISDEQMAQYATDMLDAVGFVAGESTVFGDSRCTLVLRCFPSQDGGAEYRGTVVTIPRQSRALQGLRWEVVEEDESRLASGTLDGHEALQFELPAALCTAQKRLQLRFQSHAALIGTPDFWNDCIVGPVADVHASTRSLPYLNRSKFSHSSMPDSDSNAVWWSLEKAGLVVEGPTENADGVSFPYLTALAVVRTVDGLETKRLMIVDRCDDGKRFRGLLPWHEIESGLTAVRIREKVTTVIPVTTATLAEIPHAEVARLLTDRKVWSDPDRKAALQRLCEELAEGQRARSP